MKAQAEQPWVTAQEAFKLRIKKDREYRHWVLQELYEGQTDDERTDRTTRWNNGIGFTQPDAEVLSGLAEKLENGEKLSRKEERQLILRLPQYWGQFTETTIVQPHVRKKRPGQSGLPEDRRAA
jgi:hypothetical protein